MANAGEIRGELVLGLGGWSANFATGVRQAKQLGQEIDRSLVDGSKRATESMTQLGASVAATGSRLQTLGGAFVALPGPIGETGAKLFALGATLQSLGPILTGLSTISGGVAASASAAAVATTAQAAAARAATAANAGYAASSAAAAAANTALALSARSANVQTGAMVLAGSRMAPVYIDMAGGAVRAGAAAAGMGAMAIPALAGVAAAALRAGVPIAALRMQVGLLESSSVKAYAEIEQLQIAFATLAGSKQAGDKLLGSIRQFAAETPFVTREIAGAGKQLLAMGVAADQIVPTLRRLGDISSGLSQPLGEIAYLYGQIVSQGLARTQDLNQFASRGIPIYRVLAEMLETNVAGVRKLAETTGISATQIEAAFRRMTDPGGQFYGLTQQLAESLAGLVSTMEDAKEAVKLAFGEGITAGAGLKDLLKDLTVLWGELEGYAMVAGASIGHVIKTLAKDMADTIRAINYLMSIVDPGGSMDPNKRRNVLGAFTEAELAAAGIKPRTTTESNAVATPPASGSTDKSSEKSADRAARIRDEARVAEIRRLQGDYAGDIAELQMRAAEAHRESATQAERDAVIAKFKQDVLARQAAEQKKIADEQSRAADAAGREAEARERILSQARRTMIEAQATELETAGQSLQAELLRIQATYDEAAASATTFEEQLSAIVKFEADRRSAIRRDEVARQKEAAEQAQRVMDYQLQAAQARLKTAGNDFGADLLGFDVEWKQRIASASTDQERYAAEAAYEAERRLRIQVENQRRDKEGLAMLDDGGNEMGPAGDAGSARDRRSRRALAQLERRGSLTAADRARRDRLRARVSPADAIASQVSELVGETSSKPQVNVALPGIDTRELADAIYQRVQPMVKREIDAASRAATAAAAASQVGGNL